MLRTTPHELQHIADQHNKVVYLVRVSDCAALRDFCVEECVTTQKLEADTWAKQWKGEYSKEDGYSFVRQTIFPKL